MKSPPVLSSESLHEIRAAAVQAELHPESLLRIPLVKRAFTSPDFRLVERGIDAYWNYQNVIPIGISGFNPLQGAYFYAKSSFFSRWLSARSRHWFALSMASFNRSLSSMVTTLASLASPMNR